MGTFQIFSYLVFAFVAVAGFDKRGFFDIATDQRFDGFVVGTSTAFSFHHCAAMCLQSEECKACNWFEATGKCELLGNYLDAIPSTGHTTLTRE